FGSVFLFYSSQMILFFIFVMISSFDVMLSGVSQMLHMLRLWQLVAIAQLTMLVIIPLIINHQSILSFNFLLPS
ncbi:hypothetical protein L9F63_004559, partial [Diploptera punctata]